MGENRNRKPPARAPESPAIDWNKAGMRAKKVVTVLKRNFPDARIALDYRNPLELLIATILSAQCTDKRVNLLTKTLFKKYRTPADYAGADRRELERDIMPAGFYHNKAKSIQGCTRGLIEKFGGQVPRTMEELTQLPGVGRKTANVILGGLFGQPAIVVDTHVIRLSGRLGLTREKDPVKIEFALQKLLPESDWTFFSNAMIQHGRNVCTARKPNCPVCDMRRFCPSAFGV
jgi:endonuclease III